MNILTFDLETSGSKPEYALQSWRAPHDAFITSLVWMHNGETHGGLNPTKADLLNMLVYAQENDCTIAGWNVQFDIQWLIAYGLEDEVFKCKYIDGMLLWRHLTIEPEYDATGARKKSYGLKAAVDEFMPAMAGYEENIDFHDPSPEAREKLHYYNICDVRFTASFVKKFLKELSQRQRKCALIEAECIPLIASANYRGMVVDVPAVEALASKLEQTANEKLAELAPHGVTELIIRSPAKLAKLLYDDWGLPPQGLTGAGARSTDKAALHELSLIDPRAKQLREYREALNNKTKFAETILESAAYNGDNTTHPQAIIFGTYSGRLTYASNQGRGKEQRQTGFALHQMKRGAEYRAAIKAPDGYTLLEFDAAGQEFRWMAIASNDSAMLKLCMPGQDAHAFMGNKINPAAEDKKAARQLGKIANLSLGYRTSAKKLKTVARVQYGLPMEQDEADKIHTAYQDAYSNVPVFWKQQIEKVKKDGFVETYGHRRVSVDGDWNGDSAWSMGSTAINYRIQGTGSCQKYLALAVLKPYLIEIGARFAWDLHDGIYLYVPDDKVHDAAEQIKLTLDNLPYDTAWGFTPPIPLPWDCKVGKSWGDLKEYVFEPVVAADAPDQEGVSHLTVPALPEDGEPLDGRHMDSSTKSNKASSNLVQVDFRPQNEHALEIALDFAAAGIKTFPCQADKRPAPGFMNWENAASSDPDQLRHWFLVDYKDTAAMVGMPCGPNNLVAIDPDRPKPEKGKTADGLVLFKNLVHELSIDLSGVPIIKSPSGGQHYIFAQPNDARFGCATGSLPDNVDVKGDGGYLIASGSRRADGRAYEQMPGTPSLLGSFKANTIPAIPLELRTIIGSKRAKASLDATAERMPKHLLAEALLEHNIPNDRAFSDRQDWVDMAHAIYGASGGDDAGRRMWLHWCSSQVQKPGEPEHVWNSIKADTVRAGAGYIKKQLTDRGRNELIDKIKQAEAQGIFTPVEGQSADDPKPDAINPYFAARMWDGDAKRKTVTALVKNLITADGITFIAGQPNAGKSAIAVNLAVCLAKGLKFAGKKTGTPKGVVYIAAEASGSIMDRFKAIKDAMFITDERLPICVLPFVPDLATAKDRKVFIDGLKLVMDEMAQAHDVPVGAIIIDTMARAFSMDDENSAAEMGKLIKAVDEMGSTLDCARVLIHHMGKDVRAGMRGSTALKGAADDELNVIVSPDDRYSVTLEHEKSRNYPIQKGLAFKLRSITIGVDEDGDDLTTVTASFEGEVEKKATNQRAAADTDTAVLRALFDDPDATQRDLKEITGAALGTISKSLQRLVEQGLLDYDHKSKHYSLTKMGKKQAQIGGEN